MSYWIKVFSKVYSKLGMSIYREYITGFRKIDVYISLENIEFK